jgi:N-acetylglucosaminyldiphosphoundecaprenol N-acetyl-beta-D-mannosaminyltransferase
MKEQLLNYFVNTESPADCADLILAHVKQGTGCKWMACLNPHSYVSAEKDVEFRTALNETDWLVPDGIGIVYASRVLGGRITQRVTGWDIFSELTRKMDAEGEFSVFFLGSTEDTLSRIRQQLRADYPNIRIAGTYSPSFNVEYTEDELDDMVASINSTKADVLWVSMTAPKQEKWVAQNIERLNVKFIGAVGAVFDFYTGKVKRAHPLFIKWGLEWLPRLIQEPSRLWRRMLVSAPIFVKDVLVFAVQLRSSR